jgi:hypothetical protein
MAKKKDPIVKNKSQENSSEATMMLKKVLESYPDDPETAAINELILELSSFSDLVRLKPKEAAAILGLPDNELVTLGNVEQGSEDES